MPTLKLHLMKPRKSIATALIISSFSDSFSDVNGAISALHAIDNACIITFNAPFFVSDLVAVLEIKQVDITRKCANNVFASHGTWEIDEPRRSISTSA